MLPGATALLMCAAGKGWCVWWGGSGEPAPPRVPCQGPLCVFRNPHLTSRKRQTVLQCLCSSGGLGDV